MFRPAAAVKHFGANWGASAAPPETEAPLRPHTSSRILDGALIAQRARLAARGATLRVNGHVVRPN